MSSQIQKRNRTALLGLFSRRREAWSGSTHAALLSREEFDEQLAIERARVERSGYVFSVIVFTLQCGGDSEEAARAEKALMAALVERTRLCDSKGWHGKHPAVILPYTSKAAAANLINPIDMLFRKHFVEEGHPIVPGPRLSFVIYGYPDERGVSGSSEVSPGPGNSQADG
ncbi:MAG: hypothetical protein IT364_00160 [Candidatus Hydrogenedentes bacterium]|nr:hypothetical protein [Candidatus Hydrogenedentota bacterium]